jgi:hypothetical protein
VKIVIDHVSGSRRGQRQEFVAPERVTVGRHPKCDVSFDAHRDLDASSRHAEIRISGGGYVLSDVGSSNGTFVDGQRIGEVALETGPGAVVEFGAGGPRLRIWIGDDDDAPEPLARGRGLAPHWLLAAAVLLVVAVVVALLAR